MSYPDYNDLSAFTPSQQIQIQQFVSYLKGYLSAQHKDDGSHGDVTADSLHIVKGAATTGSGSSTGTLTVDGAVTGGGSGTFAGDVIADSSGAPLTLGAAVGQSSGNVGKIGPGLDLNGIPKTQGRWTFVLEDTGPNHTLYLLDRKSGSDAPFIVLYDGTAYRVKPHPGTGQFISCYLGDQNDSFGAGRWANAYLQALDVTGAALLAGNTKSGSGSFNINTGTTQTLVSLGGPSLYAIWAYSSGGGRSAWAIASYDNVTAFLLRTDSATGDFTISLSGTNVQLSQTTGVTLAVNYSFFKIG